MALVNGYRGLPKGMTLSKLLAPLKEKLVKAGRPNGSDMVSGKRF